MLAGILDDRLFDAVSKGDFMCRDEGMPKGCVVLGLSDYCFTEPFSVFMKSRK